MRQASATPAQTSTAQIKCLQNVPPPPKEETSTERPRRFTQCWAFSNNKLMHPQPVGATIWTSCCSLKGDKLPVAMDQALSEQPAVEVQTRGTLPLVFHWRHCPSWSSPQQQQLARWHTHEVLKRFRLQHIVWENTECTETKPIGCQVTDFKHIQPAGEIQDVGGVDQVNVPFGDARQR